MRRDTQRSRIYSADVAEEICNRLARGESLKEICREEQMPSEATVYRWLMPGGELHVPEFLSHYRAARQWQQESLMERLMEVAEDPSLTAEQRKARMDAIKAWASRLEAKRYGQQSTAKPQEIRVVYEDQ